MKILRSIVGLLCVSVLLVFPSCNKSTPTAILGDWRKQAPFEGTTRAGSVAFAIGDKAYVGTGYDGTYYQNDFYVYDVKKQYWDTIAPFPGLGREQAVAFSINGKGYMGTGYNRDSVVQLRDFWEYDPATYKWKQLNDFGGEARYNAVAFSMSNYGYLGTGYNNNYFGDFWQYNPDLDSWMKIPSYRGDKRWMAMTFTIKDKTYLFGGQNNNSYTLDIWEFDPAALTTGGDPWTDRTPLTTDAQYNNFKAFANRYDAVTFTLNDLGYVTCGSNGAIINTTWQYDPSNQTYTQMTSFERSARTQAVAFVVGDEAFGFKAFVTTGLYGTTRLDDMMEFRPKDAYVQYN